jgi:hypothetical protein
MGHYGVNPGWDSYRYTEQSNTEQDHHQAGTVS